MWIPNQMDVTRASGRLLLLLSTIFSLLASASPTVAEHRRVKRLSPTTALEYGCAAIAAVKECTDLLEHCGDVCDNIQAVCNRFSRNSELISELCDNRQIELRKFVEEELPRLAQGGEEVEKALQELGDHFESLGEKIRRGFEDAANKVKDTFDDLTRGLRGTGCSQKMTLVAMATGLFLVRAFVM